MQYNAGIMPRAAQYGFEIIHCRTSESGVAFKKSIETNRIAQFNACWISAVEVFGTDQKAVLLLKLTLNFSVARYQAVPDPVMCKCPQLLS